jgi:hypothetical protein
MIFAGLTALDGGYDGHRFDPHSIHEGHEATNPVRRVPRRMRDARSVPSSAELTMIVYGSMAESPSRALLAG